MCRSTSHYPWLSRLQAVSRTSTQGERSVGDLAGFLELRDSTVSQHLSLLRRDGLVRARRDARPSGIPSPVFRRRACWKRCSADLCRPASICEQPVEQRKRQR